MIFFAPIIGKRIRFVEFSKRIPGTIGSCQIHFSDYRVPDPPPNDGSDGGEMVEPLPPPNDGGDTVEPLPEKPCCDGKPCCDEKPCCEKPWVVPPELPQVEQPPPPPLQQLLCEPGRKLLPPRQPANEKSANTTRVVEIAIFLIENIGVPWKLIRRSSRFNRHADSVFRNDQLTNRGLFNI